MKPKKIWLFYCIVVSLFFPTQTIFAAGSQILPPGLIIGDNNGVTVQTDGNYFIEVEHLWPGSTFKKEITIRNIEKNQPFLLCLQVDSAKQEGKLNLLENLSLVIKKGDKILYEGNIAGQGTSDMSKTPIELGEFDFGDSEVIVAEFTLDKTLSNEYFEEASSAEISWNFSARRDGLTEQNSSSIGGSLPSTGEEWRNAIYRICAGIFLIAMFLILLKKQKNKIETEDDDQN